MIRFTRSLSLVVFALLLAAVAFAPRVARADEKQADLVLKLIPSKGIPETVEIWNKGTAEARGSILVVRVSPGTFPQGPGVKEHYDAKLQGLAFKVPAIPPGKSATISMCMVGCANFAAGPHILEFVADAGNQVTEANTGNNKAVVNFSATGKAGGHQCKACGECCK